MLKIGSHVSFSDKGLLNAANEAVSYGSSTFMIYTGAPQNTRRKPMEKLYIPEGKEVMKQHGIEEIVVHAPYIINLGSYKEDTFDLAVNFLIEEVKRTSFIGVKNIVLHPGAYTEKDAAYGIRRIAEGLNQVLKATGDSDVNIALETMAGKGTEIGRTFEEIASIMEKVEDNDRLTVCMDTCHMHDAGYDVIDGFDGVLEQFDRIIGLERLAAVHINDSKNPRGAAKDRHAPIGSGYIGFQAIRHIVHHDALKHLPFILETPWIGKDANRQRPMYEAEIALLRGDCEKRFGPEFLEDVERLAHFLSKQHIDPRDYVLSAWEELKSGEKGKNKDKREPMERVYDLVAEARLFPDLNEEQINHRITAWFVGEELFH